MWHDTEAKVDLLNFGLVAEAAAQLIRECDGEPIAIGISGGWGVGKSSLVKMVGASLQADTNADQKYVFLEFNAWLYQDFDDARQALLQSVSDKLTELAKGNETLFDKAKKFAKRIRVLRVVKMAAPAMTGLVFGGAVAGPLGALIGAVGGLVKGAGDVSSDRQIEDIKEAYKALKPELAEALESPHEESLPKEIEGLRKAFEELLAELNVRLVVLVDDLDRCLPHTAISTLEAMRLLLYVKRTAFIIAADEQMIRGAVRAHFGEVVNDELVTSYFDKLIQVPLRVPRLGVNEVKVYVTILLAQLAVRRGKLPAQALADAQPTLLSALKNSWSGGITHEVLGKAFGNDISKISQQIDIAEQIAPLLVIAEQISGNPRLIKRFLNNLVIRESIAHAQGMSVAFPDLVKMQLFERCASAPAFEYLANAVGASDDGKAEFLGKLEAAVTKGEPYETPHTSWSTSFYEQWIRLSPALADVNLKPLLYLSRDRSIGLASYDELSPEAGKVLEALLKTDQFIASLVPQIKTLGDTEAERLLTRLVRRARSDQWSAAAVTRCFHVTKAFESLGTQFAAALGEIPGPQRLASIVPLFREEPWAQGLLSDWATDSTSPVSVRNLLKKKAGK